MGSILTADTLGMRETGTGYRYMYGVFAVIVPLVALMLPTSASLHPDNWPAISLRKTSPARSHGPEKKTSQTSPVGAREGSTPAAPGTRAKAATQVVEVA